MPWHRRQLLTGMAMVGVLAASAGYTATPAPRRVHITTLEWPPFTGAALPEQGAASEILRAALAVSRIELQLEFLPWKRTIEAAQRNPAVAGYFPSYPFDIAPNFFASSWLAVSPLGIAYRASHPVDWAELADLERYRLGTVVGYGNTEAFDAAARAGRIKVETASDDLANIRKLAAGRVDGIVIDRAVLLYYLRSVPALAAERNRILFHPHPLQDQPLVVGLPDRPDGHWLNGRIAEGLAHIDTNAILERHLAI